MISLNQAEEEARVSPRLLKLAKGAGNAADFRALHREIERANLASKPVAMMYAVYNGTDFLTHYRGMPRIYDTRAKARSQATRNNKVYGWRGRDPGPHEASPAWYAVPLAVRLMPGGDG